jgi:hypothetical protein
LIAIPRFIRPEFSTTATGSVLTREKSSIVHVPPPVLDALTVAFPVEILIFDMLIAVQLPALEDLFTSESPNPDREIWQLPSPLLLTQAFIS